MKLIVILVVIFFSSCQPVVKLLIGIRQPKLEDKESLSHYLNKKNMAIDNILVYDDSSFFKHKVNDIADLPEIRVFNKQGILIYYKDTASTCTGPAEEFTKSICSAKDLNSNSSWNITTELKKLVTLDNNPVVLSGDDSTDFYVFIYWARYIGRLNKIKVREWERNLSQVNGCKVWVAKVNMDSQKKWYEKKQNE